MGDGTRATPSMEDPIDAPRPLSHKHEEVVTNRKRGHRVSCIVVGELRHIRIGGFGMGPISQLCGFIICTKFYILWNHSPPSTSCDASHNQYIDVQSFLGRVGIFMQLFNAQPP